MINAKTALLCAALAVVGAGCNCGGPPIGEDGGAGGGGGTGGGTGGGGGQVGGGGGATGVLAPIIEFSAAAGRVGGATGLSADVQLGVIPARLRASGGPFVLEGSAVLLP